MAVTIRMKMMGRRHRPFFRVVVMDTRSPRDGRVLEEVGTYDPMVPETDARATLNSERINYWIGVGAQPSEKVAILIKKYGAKGTHLEEQKKAQERLAVRRRRPTVPTELPKPAVQQQKSKKEKAAEAAATEAKAEAAVAEAVSATKNAE